MSLYFRKASLKRACHHLQAQLTTFRPFTEEVNYPEESDKKRDYCLKLTGSVQNAVSLITSSRDDVLSILKTIETEYVETKKSEKKDFLDEFQQIEIELGFDSILESADAILSALKTRLVELRHEIAVEFPQHAVVLREMSPLEKKCDGSKDRETYEQEIPDQNHESDTAEPFDASPTAFQNLEKHLQYHNTSSADINQITGRSSAECAVNSRSDSRRQQSIQPPHVAIPKFDGRTDFMEYWSMFETMVHNNSSLSATEKMILLKDSLTGQAATAIKGIKLVPQNYDWMTSTIKKRYGNVGNVRARIIQRLSALLPAKPNIQSCESVFDEIRSLVHEMVSSGYNILDIHDPMWAETILQKLPRNIVENFLKENKDVESCSIGQMLDQLENEIARFKYVCQRLGNNDPEPKQNYGDRFGSKTKVCVFCRKANHKSYQCRTVSEASARRKVVMENNLCWKCFSDDHRSSECARPNCPHCSKLHDSTLCTLTATGKEHMSSQQRKAKGPQNIAQAHAACQNRSTTVPHFIPRSAPYRGEHATLTNAPEETTTVIISGHALNTHDSKECIFQPQEQVVLMTAEGLVWNNRKKSFERVLFFFDTGAQASLIEDEVAESLALPVLKSEPCSLSGIGGMTETFTTHHVSLKVLSAHGKELCFRMRTKPHLVKGFPSVLLMDRDITFMEENNIYLSNSKVKGETQIPQILVGVDYYSSFIIENNPPLSLPSGLRVAKTIFGMAAYGRGKVRNEPMSYSESAYSCNTIVVEPKAEAEMIKNIFELESLGIGTKEGADDEIVYEYRAKYAQSVQFEDNYVTAPFPIKENITDLKNNRNVALKRLISQTKYLNKLPEQKKWYCNIISQYIQDDIIEEVCSNVPNSVGTYYMPHSGVWRENKTTPLRIVFDASSHQRGQLSLNDVLYTGASFINKIHDILIAAREPPIILIADIQAAFTQIRIRESHRDLCRFLWLRDPSKPPVVSNIVEYRWKRVPFGTTASPSILNMVISAYLQKVDSPLANEILRYLYVDNILMTAYTEQEAVEKYKVSKKLFEAIGMNLRAYVSNSSAVNSRIDEKDRAHFGPMKLLGVTYNPVTDTFSFATDMNTEVKVKRDTLRQHHSVYDPVGFGAPLLIKQKCLLRSVFETAKDWNSVLSPKVAMEWKNVTLDIDHAHVEVPRLLFHHLRDRNSYQLWLFADASSKAMAVCSFVEHNATSISGLLTGKTKLAPKRRTLSIPRLELLALLLAMRLAESVTSALSVGVKRINIVSDSLIALHWVKTSRKLPLFVVNQKDRIKTIINRLTAFGHEVSLFHVPGEYNPADCGTRGVTSEQLPRSEWVNGPQWLLTNRHILTNINSLELPALSITEEDIITCAEVEENPKPNARGQLFELHRYGSLSKALRVVALVAKFIRRTTEKFNSKKCKSAQLFTTLSFDLHPEITGSDMSAAEKSSLD